MRVSAFLSVALVTILTASCTPPPTEDDSIGAGTQAWETESRDDETKSTHLWIVNHALEDLRVFGLGRRAATSAVSLLGDPTCRRSWQDGLFDADFKKEYNQGTHDLAPGAGILETLETGATWESHFWDPDTGRNHNGRGTKTALSEALAHAKAAKRLLPGQREAGCYELGLSLHFMTDLTQPMHAADFGNDNAPLLLHSNIEGHAMKIQDLDLGLFSVVDEGGTPEEVIRTTARDSKNQWRSYVAALDQASRADPVQCSYLSGGVLSSGDGTIVDRYSCWFADAEVNRLIHESLRKAWAATAAYLLALDLPAG